MAEDLPFDDHGNVLRSLAAGGSDLSKEMVIDFMVHVPDREIGLKLAALIAEQGFRTEVEFGESSGKWT